MLHQTVGFRTQLTRGQNTHTQASVLKRCQLSTLMPTQEPPERYSLSVEKHSM